MPELVLCLLMLQQRSAVLLCCPHLSGPLLPLLDTLDRFNRLAPGADREDAEDLAWPGIIGQSHRAAAGLRGDLLARNVTTDDMFIWQFEIFPQGNDQNGGSIDFYMPTISSIHAHCIGTEVWLNK